MTCYVQNCKTGDILSILPILYQRFKETGQKQALMVSKDFKDVLDGCSYIVPEIWDSDWQDLIGALASARKKYKDVVSLSTFGRGSVIPHNTPSFQLDQWNNAGCLDKFGQWPLVFDQRSPEREKRLVESTLPKAEPFILLGDHSQSSPFEHMDDLYQLIKKHFTAFTIIRLSEVKAEKIYDLLGLYDRAATLVTIETMHLHLSAASEVPVISLVTDKPEFWHGSAWHPRFRLHVRYSDYNHRKPEIVRSISDAINSKKPPQVSVTGIGGYNMSVFKNNGTNAAVYRWHPNKKFWRTELALNDGTVVRKVIPPDKYKDYSIEDGRVFMHNGKPHISYTVVQAPQNVFNCVVQYGALVQDGDVWRIIGSHQPKYGKNDFTSMEKNWSFWSHGQKIYAAYQRSPEQIVLHIHESRVVQEFKTNTPETWQWGQIRGGTDPIPHNGLLLQFFHTLHRNNKSKEWWTYYTGALLMEPEPPFQIVRVSSFPILAGNERYFPNIKQWKPRCFLPYGAIKNDDGSFLVSLGYNDSATATVRLTEADLNL